MTETKSAGIAISVTQNDNPATLFYEKIVNNNGTGYGSVVIRVDGTQADESKVNESHSEIEELAEGLSD